MLFWRRSDGGQSHPDGPLWQTDRQENEAVDVTQNVHTLRCWVSNQAQLLNEDPKLLP